MKRLTSALFALSLLLAFAAPVAAVDPTPEPAPYGETPACPPVEIVDGVYVIPKDAPEGCMYIQGGGDPSVEPVPVECDPALGCETLIAPMPIAEPLPCDPEIVAAAGSENQLIAPAPCLLPDGTLYELAGRGTQPNERGEELPDYETLYANWFEEFKKGLEACPEGIDPSDMNVTTCLLPDGSVAGPVPLFAAPTTDGGIADSGAVEESSGSLLPIVAIVALVGLGGLLLVRRRAA